MIRTLYKLLAAAGLIKARSARSGRPRPSAGPPVGASRAGEGAAEGVEAVAATFGVQGVATACYLCFGVRIVPFQAILGAATGPAELRTCAGVTPWGQECHRR